MPSLASEQAPPATVELDGPEAFAPTEPEAVELPHLALPPAPASADGGAGSPELAKMTADGRVYVDPLPWCPMLGALGISETEFELNATFSSVTTLLGNLPKDRLIGWTASTVADCAIQDRWVIDVFGEDIAKWWFRTAGERTRDTAGTRGTMVHDVAEDGETILRKTADALLAGQDIDPRFLADNNVAAYVMGLQKFFAAYPGIVPIWTEVTVFSRRYGYAGTLDLIAWVPGLGVVLIDWKTSNYVLAKFSFQFAAYRWADYGIGDGVRVPVPPVEDAHCVHIVPGEDNEGGFEVVPVDSRFELVDRIMPAMHSIKALDHPSRIGKPIGPADLTAAAAARPKLTIVTPHQAAAVVAAGQKSRGDIEMICRPPEEQVQIMKGQARRWQLDFCVDATKLIAELARSSDPARAAAATRALTGLTGWLRKQDMPKLSDPAVEDPDQFVEQIDALVNTFEKAARALELPFSMPAPQRFDWGDILVDTIEEQIEAEQIGLIVRLDDDTFVPAVVRPQLERNAVTLLRRGRSVDPADWSKPRDAAATALEAELIERASTLPADLHDELVAWARSTGVPNLRLGVANDEQLRATAAQIDLLLETWHRRVAVFGDAFDDLTIDDKGDVHELVLRTVGAERRELMTEAQIEQALLLLSALAPDDTRVLAFDCGEWMMLVEPDDVIKTGEFGGAREFLTAARATAAQWGRPTPKSSKAVFDDPVLAALTIVSHSRFVAGSAA